jgi:hypothetical protein
MVPEAAMPWNPGRMRRFAVFAMATALVASSCTPMGPPPPPPASPAPSGPSGPVATPPPPPAPVPTSAILVLRGAVSSPLSADGTEPVDPAAAFEIRSPLALRGARLVLLDARDGMVPSASETEIGQAGSRFSLTPQDPLTPAAGYLLRLEGLESRLLRSDDGLSFEPLVIAFRVAGEPPPEPPRKSRKKRGR